MVMYDDSSTVKVYTVNGAASGSSSSLPDWLTRKRVAKKGKRAIREHVEGTIDLLQEFEFPEASNRIKTTRDGNHAMATGVYKPQMRVYDLNELSLKFESHTNAENVDFIILSDDWTKTLHLQADRSVELHTQGGFHYRTRIPRFGRAIAYHYPSCDAIVAASGGEVYRLNLDQGRFLNPFVLKGDGSEEISGVNVVDINPAHQLLAFGVEGNGSVEFWDPRSRSRVALLRLPNTQASEGLSVTAIASRSDGLSYAVGTSTGHTLLYDIRSPRHYAIKDLGYGLPVKNVCWIEGGSKVAGDGMVLSADRKVIKIWDRNNQTGNFASITPSYPINDVHHIPGSGLLMLANEGIQMTSFYIPQLGPAPRWCSFLDNITEEMEDQTVRSVYEDYKFVERGELAKLGLDNLVGTPALKPYMHGYFVSLRLYDAARLIANPFAYEEHREQLITDKINKLSETRIRARKDAVKLPKINKELAERIVKEAQRSKKWEEKKKTRDEHKKAAGDLPEKDTGGDMDVEEEDAKIPDAKANLLNDTRFKALFENPEFQVDEYSREFAMLNPSTAMQQKDGKRLKTAVESEEEESDRPSSFEGEDDDSIRESEDGGSGSEDSSDAGDLEHQYDPRARPDNQGKQGAPMQRQPRKQVRMVDAAPRVNGRDNAGGSQNRTREATFGQRRQSTSKGGRWKSSSDDRESPKEMSWIPSGDSLPDKESSRPKKNGRDKHPGVEYFGAGMERGGEGEFRRGGADQEARQGRTKRRSGVRSGSKNTFRNV